MIRSLIPPRISTDPECQSAMARLAIWLLGGSYLGLATFTGYYPIPAPVYFAFFAIFLAIAVGLLVSVNRHPNRKGRRLLALLVDLSATSLAVYLTDGAHSPFFLLYIWIVIANGTRYGTRFLFTSSTVAALQYAIVLTIRDEWTIHIYEAGFQLTALFLIPLYLNTLLKSLHEARLAADAASRTKSEFLANMSHEIRTPLHGALGMVTLLEKTPLSGEQQDYVESLRNCAQVLRTLIDDILDFSKIEAGKLRLEQQPFQIREVVQEVIQLLSPLADEKGLSMSTRLPNGLPGPVSGDALRLRQVLLNLVGNAIKFTDSGGVTVRVSERPSRAPGHLAVRFHVEDTGIGIPPDQLAQIFDSFHQADRSTARSLAGTGLGTSISRKLVETMGGRIGVQSDPGKGSTFWFDLYWPLLEPAEPVTATPPPLPVSDDRFDGERILLAEDSAIGAKAVSTMLSKAGFAVDVVTNGKDALERLGQEVYALVLMDLHMPDMGGLEATRRWRDQEPADRTVPIVALTANVTAEDRTRCLQSGMNDFLAKPVDSPELMALIHRHIRPANA